MVIYIFFTNIISCDSLIKGEKEIAKLMGGLLWCNVLKGNPSYLLWDDDYPALSRKDSADTLLWQPHISRLAWNSITYPWGLTKTKYFLSINQNDFIHRSRQKWINKTLKNILPAMLPLHSFSEVYKFGNLKLNTWILLSAGHSLWLGEFLKVERETRPMICSEFN